MIKGPFQDIIKKVQKTQEEIAKTQKELENLQVEGDSAGGMVKVVVNGKQELLDLKIEKELVNPDEIEMLEDLIIAAVNQALSKSQELAQEELSKVTGGVFDNLPNILKIPGLTE